MMCGNFSKNLVFLLLAGLFFSVTTSAQAQVKEESVKPSIKEMTSQKASEEVSAQIPISNTEVNTHSAGLGIGQTKIDGDFSNHGDDKITPSLFYNYSASYSFDLLVELHSTKHSLRNESVRLTGLPIGVKAKIMHYDAFTPFAVGGLGFYYPSERRLLSGQMVDSQVKATLGVHLGAGADLRLNRRFSIGVIGAYYDPFDVKQDQGPAVSGRYYKLLLTGFYHF